jgi:predicted TIM-barrel fold metal-dependent hydrolase
MNHAFVIDADSHVEEPTEAWEYLDAEYRDRKPFPIAVPNRPILANLNAFWWVDGQIFPKISGRGHTVFGTPPESNHAKSKTFSIGSQTLTKVPERLQDMNRASVDIQVIFPTVFLEPLTDDVEFEAALMRSYNTWISHACKENPDRLKWAAIMPLRNIPAAVQELKRTRDMGAVTALIYGTVGEKLLDQPEFEPFFAEAEKLQFPISIHTGWSHPGLKASGTTIMAAHVVTFTFPLLLGFYGVVAGGLLDRFPKLKIAFLEAGADWIPYLIQRMDHYFRSEKAINRPGLPQRLPSNYLKDGNIYFTCEGDEELLPQVLKRVGDDQIMISADMPHAEARENSIVEIKERSDLSDVQKIKILGENATRFYAL